MAYIYPSSSYAAIQNRLKRVGVFVLRRLVCFAGISVLLLATGCGAKKSVALIDPMPALDGKITRLQSSLTDRCMRKHGFQYAVHSPFIIPLLDLSGPEEIKMYGSGKTQITINMLRNVYEHKLDTLKQSDPNRTYRNTLDQGGQQSFDSAEQGCKVDADLVTRPLRQGFIDVLLVRNQRTQSERAGQFARLESQYLPRWVRCMRKSGYEVKKQEDVMNLIDIRIAAANNQLDVLESTVLNFDKQIYSASFACLSEWGIQRERVVVETQNSVTSEIAQRIDGIDHLIDLSIKTNLGFGAGEPSTTA
jgi:hypothetical protein